MNSVPGYPRLQASIFAGAFVFGVVMSSLGALLPALTVAAGLDREAAGTLFLSMNFAMLVGSLIFGPVCDRFGYRLLLILSTAFVGGGFGLLAVAGKHSEILSAVFVLGLGGGSLNGGANALLSDISADRRGGAMNLLGIFFGFGALLTPFLIGSWMGRAGLKGIVFVLSLATLAPLALFVRARFPAAKHGGGFESAGLRSALASPLLYAFGLLLFFQSGNEFTIGGWLSTFLQERHRLEPGMAAYVLALYWFAILLGRLAASRLARSMPPAAMVAGGALLALAATAGLILIGLEPASLLFAALIGLGFSSIFPTTLAQAGAAFTAYSGTAFSVIFVMALTGGMTAPWLVGRIAQDHGVGAGFWVTVASCCAIVALQGLIGVMTRKPR